MLFLFLIRRVVFCLVNQFGAARQLLVFGGAELVGVY